jgi:deoxycytidine triphosphate deaminase
MSVLCDKEIRAFQKKYGIITNETFIDTNVRSANYDLRIGEKYILCRPGEKSLKGVFTSDTRSIEFPPGGLAFLHSEEILNLPENIIGHLQSTFRLARRGLALLHSNQIEPGHKGIVVIILFNFSGQTQILNCNHPIVTIEFNLITECEKPFKWSQQFPGVHGDVLKNMHELIESPPDMTNISLMDDEKLNKKLNSLLEGKKLIKLENIREAIELEIMKHSEHKKTKKIEGARFKLNVIIAIILGILALLVSIVTNLDKIKSLF